jgi:hypothetical protein
VWFALEGLAKMAQLPKATLPHNTHRVPRQWGSGEARRMGIGKLRRGLETFHPRRRFEGCAY